MNMRLKHISPKNIDSVRRMLSTITNLPIFDERCVLTGFSSVLVNDVRVNGSLKLTVDIISVQFSCLFASMCLFAQPLGTLLSSHVNLIEIVGR